MSRRTQVVMPGLTVTGLASSDSEERVGRTLGRGSFGHQNHGDMAGPVSVLLHEETESGSMPQHQPAVLTPIALPQRKMMEVAGTPPIAIAMSRRASRSLSRAREIREGEAEGLTNKTPTLESTLTGRAKRKKKKAQKKNALTDFTTPGPSGDEDSDFSVDHFRKRDISVERRSMASSPFIRPTTSDTNASITGGISALRQQLDALDLEPTPGNPALIRTKSLASTPAMTSPTTTSMSGSGSDIEGPEMNTYEVPLEHDFISREAEEEENKDQQFSSTMTLDHVHRKMTAHDFEPLTCLGKGSFGTVHLVKQAGTGRLFAQKMFRKASMVVQTSLIEQTKSERTILESINRHPFVVKLYYAFQDQEKLYLILQYAEGGELFTHLATERMFPEDTAAFYMAEMVLALEHLHHTVGVVYRDLKPENCLLDSEGHLLLTDFGLSKVAVEGSERCTSILGTIEYMAPEVILGHMYGKVVDWWSFGALGFDLLTGSPPFSGNNHAKIQEKIIKSKLNLPYFLGPDAKDLLTRLLRKEPHKRLGANMPKDMQTIKKHRFFRKIDWRLLENRELDPPIKPLITDPELAENFAEEFTSLALSPIDDSAPWSAMSEESNPFGGFSYVASKSMLDYESFL